MSESGEATDLVNKSVVKAVRLLRELAAQPAGGATASTLAKASRISRPTAFRLLHSLERAGLLDRVSGNYVLGWEMARLGRLADPYAGLATRTQPVLQELADEFNESVTFSVATAPDHLDLVAEAAGSHVVGATTTGMVGKQYPLHASSSGKVLLSEMPPDMLNQVLPATLESFTPHTVVDREVLLRELAHVREQGYGMIDNELEEGLLSISCPIRDSAGKLAAVVTINAPRYRFGRDRVPEAVGRMRRTVQELAGVLWPDSAG
ncbi:IclR family transcriptional regulator [Pseudonocardia sp. C8]|uniref:IclR family transcriptional regulator n=1 Tax=Pseudonocardia sp. C8 TaxID=2762759 RepID=UPI0016433786|nr:IclR family transcriptional regulator [Pseudonocardia sp. C8]MBC3190387.1 IclR family transcriptional regulator [Pseudonocardia sp. C8]